MSTPSPVEAIFFAALDKPAGPERADDGARHGRDIEHAALGVRGTAFPIRAAAEGRQHEPAARAVVGVDERQRRVNRAHAQVFDRSERRGLDGGREVDEIVLAESLPIVGGRFRRKPVSSQ